MFIFKPPRGAAYLLTTLIADGKITMYIYAL